MRPRALAGLSLIQQVKPAVRAKPPIDKSRIYRSGEDTWLDSVDYYNDVVRLDGDFSWTHLFEIQRLAEGMPVDKELVDQKLLYAMRHKQRFELHPIPFFGGNVIDATNSHVWYKRRAVTFAHSIYQEIGSTFFIGMDGFQGDDGYSRAIDGHHRTSWVAMNHFLGGNNYRHVFFDDWGEVNKAILEKNYLRKLLRQNI